MLILGKLLVSLGNLTCGLLSLFLVACLIVTMFYILINHDTEKALLTGIISLAALVGVGIISICVTHIYIWIIIDIIFLFLAIMATISCLKPKK